VTRPRKAALDSLIAQIGAVEKHLHKLENRSSADWQNVKLWVREIRDKVRIMESQLPHIGRKTRAEYEVLIRSFYDRLHRASAEKEEV